jgi:cold shock CspA family protein
MKHERGYGFILGTNGSRDVYFPTSVAVDSAAMRSGDWVEYEVAPPSLDGRVRASYVELLR